MTPPTHESTDAPTSDRRNVLITGASSGLGEGMAREFAARGYDLALCARRTDRLEALRDELRREHPQIRVELAALDVNEHPRVFDVFTDFAERFGHIDRIVVNAGLGKGQPLGTGRFDANLATAQTNFVAALAQVEAAMQIFREQGDGHLVAIGSMSAIRGLPKSQTTYAATKAGLAALCEGLRVELRKKRSRIKVSTIHPGYIRTEINAQVKNARFMVDAQRGCQAMVQAIEREPRVAHVPAWPWVPMAWILRRGPEWLLTRLV